jgi:hypothetical protein
VPEGARGVRTVITYEVRCGLYFINDILAVIIFWLKIQNLNANKKTRPKTLSEVLLKTLLNSVLLKTPNSVLLKT